MSGKARPLRVADRIQVEMSEILRLVKDPRLGFITITGVDVTDDLRSARIYVSALSTDELSRSMQTLERAKGFIRTQLGGRLNLRFVPDLHFREDRSAERGQHIEELLQDLKDPDPSGDPE